MARLWSTRARSLEVDDESGDHRQMADPDGGGIRKGESVADDVEREVIKGNGGGRAGAGGGGMVVDGEEWQEMLSCHVKGFSESLSSKLSEWNAKQQAAVGDEVEACDTEGSSREGGGQLLVCLPPDDHPFRRPCTMSLRHTATGNGNDDDVMVQQKLNGVAAEEEEMASMLSGHEVYDDIQKDDDDEDEQGWQGGGGRMQGQRVH